MPPLPSGPRDARRSPSLRIVHVFGAGDAAGGFGPLTGNPLAVLLPGAAEGDREGDGDGADRGPLGGFPAPFDDPGEAMQALARQLGFSETTFVLAPSPGPDGWPVRIFTPERELPFAGHPVLGTALVILRDLLGGEPGPATAPLILDLAGGPVEVRFGALPTAPPSAQTTAQPDAPPGTGTAEGRGVSGRDELVWMAHPRPRFGERPDRQAIARDLGLAPEALAPDLPVEEVATGLPFLIVPVERREDLFALGVEAALRSGLLERWGVVLFTRHPLDGRHHLHARVFAHLYGAGEDAATGSAAGCLAAYLLRHDPDASPPGPGARLHRLLEQGHGLGRPSVLHLFARQERPEEAMEVWVGGTVEPLIRGRLAGW